MATQFQLAHSDWVKGVGVIAGGPYYCAQGDITTALAQCVNKVEGEISLNALNKKAKQYEAEGKIASLNNMKDAKVWLFTVRKTPESLHKSATYCLNNTNSGQTLKILPTSMTSPWRTFFQQKTKA